MEYVYAAMLLHKSGQKVDESNVKRVLESASVKIDETRIKALVSALEGVNIDEAIKKAAIPVATAQSAPVAGAPEADQGEKKAKEEKKSAEEEKKSEEQAAAGLGSLFG